MPCQMMGPVFEEVSELFPDVKFFKVNVDEEPELANEFSISGIPCIIIINGGREVHRFTGFRQKNDLIAEVREGLMK